MVSRYGGEMGARFDVIVYNLSMELLLAGF